MIITTTNSIEGKYIRTYHGLVSAQVISGANILRDFFASIRDLTGGRSASYEEVLKNGRNEAMLEMTKQASIYRGANAILGVNLNYSAIGANESMLLIYVYGTAVTIE
jgi:uncharacterized protein YbjQ (UPF0145 family)